MSYTIISNDQLVDARDFRSLVLAQRHSIPIKLSSLGKVVAGVENNMLGGWSGTNRAVLVIISKQAGANVIETVERIKAQLPQLERWIPPTVTLSILATGPPPFAPRWPTSSFPWSSASAWW